MRYATKIGNVEWEIDLDLGRLICVEDPKITRKLGREEVSHLRKIINGRKS